MPKVILLILSLGSAGELELTAIHVESMQRCEIVLSSLPKMTDDVISAGCYYRREA